MDILSSGRYDASHSLVSISLFPREIVTFSQQLLISRLLNRYVQIRARPRLAMKRVHVGSRGKEKQTKYATKKKSRENEEASGREEMSID